MGLEGGGGLVRANAEGGSDTSAERFCESVEGIRHIWHTFVKPANETILSVNDVILARMSGPK